MTLNLFDNRLAPLTYSIGFLNAPITEVADAITQFLTRISLSPTLTPLSGNLEDNLLHLQPLTVNTRPKTLLTSTTTPGWTALFDAHAHGDGVAQICPMMAREMSVRGYCVASVLPSSIATKSLGGRQFWVLGPEQLLGHIRSINLIENYPGKRHFEARSEVQPYEDLEAYTNRRRTQRLTDDMLLDYTAAVGLHPWDEDFYTNPSYLITNTSKPLLSHTLKQAQTELGIPPHLGHDQ